MINEAIFLVQEQVATVDLSRNLTNVKMEEIKTKIRAFLERHFRTCDLQDNEDFFAAGFVNSLFMQLVLFVEREFNLKVEDEDLDISNFNTVDAINGFIERKNGPRREPAAMVEN